MEEQRPIKNLPMYYVGAVLGLLGLAFTVLGEGWLAIVSSLLSISLYGDQFLKILIMAIPVSMLIAGVALMLNARKEKKMELPNDGRQ